MRVARALTTGLAAMLVLSACANDDEQNDPPPIPDDAAEESNDADDPPEDDEAEDDEIDVSTAPADPDDITIEYVQAVMDEINPIIQAGAAVLAEVQDTSHPDVVHLYSSAYEEEAAQRQLAQFQLGAGPEELRNDPGPIATAVEDVLLVTDGCVLFTAERDFRPIFEDEDIHNPTQPYYLRLEQSAPEDPNRTAWHLTLDTYFSDESDVPPIEEACP